MPLHVSTPASPPTKRAARPVFTYGALVIAALGAVYIEYDAGRDASAGPISFYLFAPIIAMGYGIDWARLRRPGAFETAWALILSAVAAGLVVYGNVHDWLPTTLATVAVASGLVVARWAIASIPRSAMEGTFLGHQGGALLFADERRCVALKSKRALDLQVGRRYAFVAKLERPDGGAGPFRESNRCGGTLKKIATSRDALLERRFEQAWNYTRIVLTATTLVALALVLSHLEF